MAYMKRAVAVLLAAASIVACDCTRNPMLRCGPSRRDTCPDGSRARLSTDAEDAPACVSVAAAK
jgi:hypothetical protein